MVSRSIAFLIACILLVSGCASRNTSNASIKVTKTSLDEEPPQLLNAFFGLDKLPLRALPLWSKAPGKDGMPVTFSRRVRDPIDETAFTVITMSGKQLKPGFATLLPADAPDERHTVLLIGELANMPDDPPVTVDLESFDGHDLGVSRHHAMIKQIKDNLVLVDLDSINGTFVNGHRAIPLKRYNIMDGDTVTIGRLTLEIRFMKRNRH